MLCVITRTAVTWIRALVYGAIVVFELLKQIYTKGPMKTFSWKVHKRPPCLDDPTLGTHGYLHLEDVRIHYVASGPEGKPLMLFLHGFPEFWYLWRYQLKEFQKDYRVVAIDMRGNGDSDKPSSLDAYVMKKLINDVKQVILGLGYKSCILVAHDWGGAVAWTFGRQFPNMVDKLIIMNAPPAPVFQKVLRTHKEQRKRSWYIFFFQLPFLPELYFKADDFNILDSFFSAKGSSDAFKGAFQNPLNEEDLSAYKYTFSQKGALTPVFNYYRAKIQGRGQVEYDMNYIMPVLVIWGLKDIALCSAMPDVIEELYPSITVKRFPEAGHIAQVDTPDLVNQTMRDWLKN